MGQGQRARPASDVEAIFTGWFRGAYYVVKAVALYVFAFSLCYYWPLFLEFMIARSFSDQARLVAGVLLTPVGFLVLGGAHGKAVFLQHLAILALGAFVFWMASRGQDAGSLEALVSTWTPVMVGVYGLGIVATARALLKSDD